MGVNELCSQVLYYRRDIVTLPKFKNNTLSRGDEINFTGSLFSDEARTILVGTTNIRYTIRAIQMEQAIIQIGVTCMFHEGTVALVGSIVTENLSLSKSGTLNAYTTKVSSLAVTNGTADFERVLGDAFYQINGPGIGVFILNCRIPVVPIEPPMPICPIGKPKNRPLNRRYFK
jgi:hypothetical protein